MKTLALLILTFLPGCNGISRHIDQQVDRKVEIAKEHLSAEVRKAKEDFIAQYQAAEDSQPDSLNKLKLHELKSAIFSTDNYLDSLKQEMNKLDDMDVQNIEVVEAAFLYKGAGDSIINKLKNSISAAQYAAKTERQNLAIKAASDSLFSEPSAEKWKALMFGLTSPLGASMIIYGLQVELYNIGMKALSDKHHSL